jgi:predicted YcjX-like family ATPase
LPTGKGDKIMNDSLEQIINDVTDLSQKIVDFPPKTIDDLLQLSPKFREFSKRINEFGANDVSDILNIRKEIEDSKKIS